MADQIVITEKTSQAKDRILAVEKSPIIQRYSRLPPV